MNAHPRVHTRATTEPMHAITSALRALWYVYDRAYAWSVHISDPCIAGFGVESDLSIAPCVHGVHMGAHKRSPPERTTVRASAACVYLIFGCNLALPWVMYCTNKVSTPSAWPEEHSCARTNVYCEANRPFRQHSRNPTHNGFPGHHARLSC